MFLLVLSCLAVSIIHDVAIKSCTDCTQLDVTVYSLTSSSSYVVFCVCTMSCFVFVLCRVLFLYYVVFCVCTLSCLCLYYVHCVCTMFMCLYYVYVFVLCLSFDNRTI